MVHHSPAGLIPGIPLVDSPLFPELFADGVFGSFADVAAAMHADGFAVIDLGRERLFEVADAIRCALGPSFDFDGWGEHGSGGLRVQDAWRFVPEVKQLALEPMILQCLEILYGRRPFAFQTLNFPVGTQQHFHSDAVHFHSDPPGFMCGVWVALEDIHPDAGPLEYFPGSHRLPYLQVRDLAPEDRLRLPRGQEMFHPAWQAMVSTQNLRRKEFLPRVGQALIWAANLLHGGTPVLDRRRTRWSQVTHYFFEHCDYYTPMHSTWPRGPIAWRDPLNVATGQCRSGAPDPSLPAPQGGVPFSRLPDFLRLLD